MRVLCSCNEAVENGFEWFCAVGKRVGDLVGDLVVACVLADALTELVCDFHVL